MSRILALSVLAVGLISVTSAQAAAPTHQSTYAAPASYDTSTKQPDLISFGAGYMDFDKSESHKQSGDFRGEYRWGLSLLPLLSSYFNSWDKYVQFHPYAGVEVTTLGAFYGSGGWAMDGYVGKHIILTWSEGVGLYEPGNMQSLHGTAEFRSMLEAGYRFDNEMRITGQISHISDAGLTKRNPGAEIAGVYFHVPVNMFCGK